MSFFMKYKQKHIPEIRSSWSHLSAYDLRRVAFDYYRQRIAGTCVINRSTGFPIHFTVRGGKKLLKGGNFYATKAEMVKALPSIMKNAAYNNWGNRKSSDKKNVIGYLNFKCKVVLDSETLHLRIAVRLYKNGKLYYNHEVNKWKK